MNVDIVGEGVHSTIDTRIPDCVDSPNGKLVYLYLQTTGGASLTDAKQSLDLPQLTLLSVLRKLREKGHVVRDGETYLTERPA